VDTRIGAAHHNAATCDKEISVDCPPLNGAQLRKTARRHLRHFLADFSRLEAEFPGSYPHVIVSGEGAYVYDDSGRRLLDAGNHLGACNIGHGRREVAQRMAEQAERLEFSALDSGNSHDVAIRYAQRLAQVLPIRDACLSFCTSGSESNELAFKIARHYFHATGQLQRTKILSRVGSYHGSSYAAMSATGIGVFSAGFGPLPEGFRHVPQPSPDRCEFCRDMEGCTLACIDATRELVEREGSETIAAVVGEPVAIPQAVKIPHPDYWPRLRQLCTETGSLLIVDEVVTGFGRTGRMFGIEHWNVEPDIMVMAKGITGGYAPMGAVAVSRAVNDTFDERPLVHLNTFSGHPVACAAADATLDVLEAEDLVANARSMGAILTDELQRMRQAVPQILRISSLGLMSSVEVDAAAVPDIPRFVRKLRQQAYEHNLLVRANPDGTRVAAFFYPALTVNEDDIVSGVRSLEAALRATFAFA
jgi:adenosylmethionine-8-amino-7-oxononanoate aminotransferase